jgi:hypothetical protein
MIRRRQHYVGLALISLVLVSLFYYFFQDNPVVKSSITVAKPVAPSFRKQQAADKESNKFNPLVLGVLLQPDSNIWYLREFVGSFHKTRHSGRPLLPLIYVIGMGMIADEVMEEIGLWQSVEFIRLGTIVAGHLFSDLSKTNPVEIDKAFILNYLTKIHGHAILIDLKMSLRRDVGVSALAADLATAGQIVTEGLEIEGYTRADFQKLFQPYLETCIQGGTPASYPAPKLFANMTKYHMFPSIPKALDPASGSQNFCHLALRPETMYAPLFMRSDSSSPSENSSKKKICFGIPTKNSVNVTAAESPLITTFLKTFIPTVSEEEWSRFDFGLYVGYDHGDPLLDGDKGDFKVALNAATSDRPIHVKYSKLPTSKWLSWIWNVLFVAAMKDQCDYFYQVNDDITMDGTGWVTHFTSSLEQNNGIGVAGHSDDRWKCGLLTQAFVSRKHYDIFGYFFPLEIRDWFTDNWISVVYGPLGTICRREFKIGNGSAGQRYTQCDQPLWREAIAQGQQRIAAWKKANMFT